MCFFAVFFFFIIIITFLVDGSYAWGNTVVPLMSRSRFLDLLVVLRTQGGWQLRRFVRTLEFMLLSIMFTS